MSSDNNQKISVVEGIKRTGMPYIRLGKSGLQVSRICLGMMTYGSTKWREWVLEEQESRPFVKRALELGVNFFDTADMVKRTILQRKHLCVLHHANLVFIRCK